MSDLGLHYVHMSHKKDTWPIWSVHIQLWPFVKVYVRLGGVLTSKLASYKAKKNMCGSGYPNYPKFLPPTLNVFSPNSEVGRE